MKSLQHYIAENNLSDVESSWHPRKGLFTEKNPKAIANYLLKNSKDEAQAMQRLNFYMNRAGDKLTNVTVLNQVKQILKKSKVNESINFKINRDTANNNDKAATLETFLHTPFLAIRGVKYAGEERLSFRVVRLHEILDIGTVYKVSGGGEGTLYNNTPFHFKDENNLVLCDCYYDRAVKNNYNLSLFIHPFKNAESIQFLSQLDKNTEYSIQDIVEFIGVDSPELEEYLSNIYTKKCPTVQAKTFIKDLINTLNASSNQYEDA